MLSAMLALKADQLQKGGHRGRARAADGACNGRVTYHAHPRGCPPHGVSVFTIGNLENLRIRNVETPSFTKIPCLCIQLCISSSSSGLDDAVLHT